MLVAPVSGHRGSGKPAWRMRRSGQVGCRKVLWTCNACLRLFLPILGALREGLSGCGSSPPTVLHTGAGQGFSKLPSRKKAKTQEEG